MPAFIANNLFIFIFAIVVIGCLIGLAVILLSALKREKEFEHKEEKVLSQYDTVLLQAHESARKILTEATARAAQLDQQTSISNKEIEAKVNALFKEALAEFVTAYRRDLEAMRGEFKNDMGTMFIDIRKLVEEDITSIQKTLLSQTGSLHDLVSKKTEEALSAIEKELAAYKQQRIRAVDAQVDTLVIKISQEFLDRTITTSDHQKLIADALEHAKKEGVLTNDSF